MQISMASAAATTRPTAGRLTCWHGPRLARLIAYPGTTTRLGGTPDAGAAADHTTLSDFNRDRMVRFAVKQASPPRGVFR